MQPQGELELEVKCLQNVRSICVDNPNGGPTRSLQRWGRHTSPQRNQDSSQADAFEGTCHEHSAGQHGLVVDRLVPQENRTDGQIRADLGNAAETGTV